MSPRGKPPGRQRSRTKLDEYHVYGCGSRRDREKAQEDYEETWDTSSHSDGDYDDDHHGRYDDDSMSSQDFVPIKRESREDDSSHGRVRGFGIFSSIFAVRLSPIHPSQSSVPWLTCLSCLFKLISQ